MSLMVRQDRCIGCGACDFSCHTDALMKTDSFLGIFEIDLAWSGSGKTSSR